MFELLVKAIHLTGELQWIIIYLSSEAEDFKEKLSEEFYDPITTGGYAGFMIYLNCKINYSENKLWNVLMKLSRLAPLDILVTCISFDSQFNYEGEDVGVIVTLMLDGKYHLTVDSEDYFKASRIVEKFQESLRANAIKVALNLEEQ